ncbi:bacteriophage N4 adsorption protein B [compost metagenome]
MSKLVLSGDLSLFRVELVVRILEAMKFDGEVAIESAEKGQFSVQQGRVVGARTLVEQGLKALAALVTQRSGTFSVRTQTADEIYRNQELLTIPDNATIFRQVHAMRGQGHFAQQVAAATAQAQPTPQPPAQQMTVPKATPASSGPGTGPMSPPKSANQTIVRRSQGSGPLARVPEVTDKGKIAIRSIQTNYALRGVQVEADTWKLLAKVDGQSSLFQLGEAVGLMGDRLVKAVEELQREGHIRFQAHEPNLDHLKNTQSKFRFGEYMVAKGVITEIQLDAALKRQQELARRGRYMWLGEILVELNYARPSQVQEALALQKRQNS